MWLFSPIYKKVVQTLYKFISLSVFLLLVSGCSDLNIRQLDNGVQKTLQMVTVPDISSREGQLYVRELRNLLHIGGKAREKYKLTTKIYSTNSNTLSVEGASSTLKKMTMEASFILYDVELGQTLVSDSVIGDTTLGTVSSLFGQGRAETHSKERLAILLAQRVVRRLQLYFLEREQR